MPTTTSHPAPRRLTEAAFAKLSPLDQRKAIGRDVLERLATRQITPQHRVWVRLREEHTKTARGKVETDLQKLLKAQKPCATWTLRKRVSPHEPSRHCPWRPSRYQARHADLTHHCR